MSNFNFEEGQRYKLADRVLELTYRWRPIETAPNDGTEIIVTNGFEVCTCRYSKSNILNDAPYFAKSCNGEFWNDGEYYNHRNLYIYEPTHWMPLPELPREE